MVSLQLACRAIGKLFVQSGIVLEEALTQPIGKFDSKTLRALAFVPVRCGEVDRFANAGTWGVWNQVNVVLNGVLADADTGLPTNDARSWRFGQRRLSSWESRKDNKGLSSASLG